MTKIKAIETAYKGFRFRSRLEARWAVFFDAMKWGWRYEPQGYDIGGEWYLPDFWVPTLGWVEVKGAMCAFDMARLLDATKRLPEGPESSEILPAQMPGPAHGKLVILGDVPDPATGWRHVELGLDYRQDHALWRYAVLGVYGTYPLTEWRFAPADGQSLANLAAWSGGYPSRFTIPPSAVTAAYSAARSARFEHGEQP